MTSKTLTILGVAVSLVVAGPVFIYLVLNYTGKGVFAVPFVLGISVYALVDAIGQRWLGSGVSYSSSAPYFLVGVLLGVLGLVAVGVGAFVAFMVATDSKLELLGLLFGLGFVAVGLTLLRSAQFMFTDKYKLGIRWAALSAFAILLTVAPMLIG